MLAQLGGAGTPVPPGSVPISDGWNRKMKPGLPVGSAATEIMFGPGPLTRTSQPSELTARTS